MSGRNRVHPLKTATAVNRESSSQFATPNTYEFLDGRGKIRTALNGHLCTDLDDPKIAPRGITALQVHAGGRIEVRFNFQIEVIQDG